MEVSVVIAFAILLGLICLLLATGMWVGFALAFAGLAGAALLGIDIGGTIGTTLWGSVNSFTLTCVPLFIFMGEIILRSGLSGTMYRGVSRWTSFIPGRLLHANIVTCAIMAAACGTSVATAATVGTVAIPEQEGLGYGRRMVAGSLAGGGTLGILIPPSLMMIVYGAFTGNSVGQLFMGGIIPGIILAGMYMTYILIACLREPSQAPQREKLGWVYLSNFVTGLKEVWYMIPLVFIIWGSIYLGWATPTEAAAVGAFFALIVAAIHRKLNLQVLKEAGMSVASTTAFIMWVFIGACILSQALGLGKIPAGLCELIGSLGLSRYIVWLIIIIFYILLGMFMDTLAMLVLTIPITYPLMVLGLGFDPIWFGIALVILLEMGQITPPVGLNLYVIHGLTKEKRLGDVIWGLVPFFVCQVIMLGMLTAMPQLALWLPSTMWG